MTQHPPTPAGPLAGADAAPHYVQRRTQDGIAVLTLAGPDGNRLGPDLVRALTSAFRAAQRDDGVRAVVLTARGADFCAGPWADLPPPGPDTPELPAVIEDLADLCSRIETAVKPTVCAVHGRVTSGGLALGLAAQGVVADARASLHFPEPRLGRLPPGNGAVRVAWRIGAADALRFLHAPAPVPVANADGLIEHTVTENLVPTSIELANALATGVSARAAFAGLTDSVAYRDAVTKARARLPNPIPSHRAFEASVIDCVEAAQLLPPQQALAFDLVHAQDAAMAPVARALAHLSRATRRALSTPESRAGNGALLHTSPILAALSPENAARLVPALLRSGAEVTLTAPDRDPLSKALEAVAEAQLDLVKAGRMSQSDSKGDWNRLSGRLQPDANDPPALSFADLEHAAWLEPLAPPNTPLVLWSPGAHPPPPLNAPNSAITLVPAPSRSPRLCEILVQDDSDADSVRRATNLAIRLKLTPVRAARAPVLPGLTQAASQAAHHLRGAGVTSAQLRATGLLHNGAELGEAAAEVIPLPLPIDRLVLLAVVNAGARLVRNGSALRPSDLDLTMVLGAGWPNWRGGPMAEADGIGPMVLRHELQLAATLDPELWGADALFDTLIREGKRFEDLNT